jgi:SAM-dependent methyltransferase
VTTYSAFARFYDAVMGDRSDDAAYLRELLARHRPPVRSVLELACGTGSVLKQLRADYEVTGLDASPEMLAVAAAKLPGVRLVEADMTRFELGDRFDAVVCVFDSINHLLELEQWEAVFDRAVEHLTDRGVFVFDVNTEWRLSELARHGLHAQWFGEKDLLLIEVRPDGEGRVLWDLRVFEHETGGGYVLHEETIPEAAFAREAIEAALRGRFRRVRTLDRQRSRPSAASGRLWFVAAR